MCDRSIPPQAATLLRDRGSKRRQKQPVPGCNHMSLSCLSAACDTAGDAGEKTADAGDGSAAAGIGAFTTSLFVCLLTNAAADYKTDSSLKQLLSTLDLPSSPPKQSAAKSSTAMPSPSAAAAAHTAAAVPNPGLFSVAESHPAASSSPHDLTSSFIICPATSPNALAITAYCQTWRPNAIWPCCSFVMIAPSVSVAAIYESSPSSSTPAVVKTCTYTRHVLVQQCIAHLRATVASVVSALPSDMLFQLSTGKCGPYPPKLAGQHPT
jgi:hypothetical protein